MFLLASAGIWKRDKNLSKFLLPGNDDPSASVLWLRLFTAATTHYCLSIVKHKRAASSEKMS